MIRFLSYPIGETVPGYGNTAKKPEILQTRAMKNGDACDIYSVKMENHWGTHVDCPAHFLRNGTKVADLPAAAWHFNRPQLLRVSLDHSELLTPDHLRQRIDPRSDLILFRSGWSKYRGSARYSRQNPGVHASLALWLRKRCPNIRAIGFDWVSLSSFRDREHGWEAHREFLGTRKPILIIEDMDLRFAAGALREVWVAPLRISGIDSAPCTVMGVFR